jgi:hypothetical protein
MKAYLKPHEIELLKAIIELCALIITVSLLIFTVKIRRDVTKCRNEHKNWLEQQRAISYYRIKASKSHMQFKLAEMISCPMHPEWLNKIPYDNAYGNIIRNLKLEDNFEIITE